ncbi:siderophore-interacting protein [Leucobacter weissii]|nr:siderophore-interacting protein [Leucobacter weissii]
MGATSETGRLPAYRPYRAVVAEIRRLSPHFVRVGFTGPDFDVFAEHALDQRIKIVFPIDRRSFEELGVDDEAARLRGDWYPRWRALPDDRRCPFRTYTVRRIAAAQRRLEVDFVVHHEDGEPVGPGACWLHAADIGDEVIVVGPDARSDDSHLGMDWRPGRATELLLLGDETAAPAVAGILESLPAGRRATALVEVPHDDDRLAVDLPPGAELRYLPRNGRPVGSLLEPALRDWAERSPAVIEAARAARPQQLDEVDVDRDLLWESPAAPEGQGFYAWLAGESAVIKRMRRMLVGERGIDRHRVAFMGYWRLGQAERTG